MSQHYNNLTQHVGLLESEHNYYFIECNLFSPWYDCKDAHLCFYCLNWASLLLKQTFVINYCNSNHYHRQMTGVLQEAGTAYASRTPVFNSIFGGFFGA